MKQFFFMILLVIFAIGLVSCGEEGITSSDVQAVAEGLPEGSTMRSKMTDGEQTVEVETQWMGIQPTWTPVVQEVQPTAVPPTKVPPTAVPPTEVPPTEVPPTAVPPTEAPPKASCPYTPTWIQDATGKLDMNSEDNVVDRGNMVMADSNCVHVVLKSGEKYTCPENLTCVILGEYDPNIAGVDKMDPSVQSRYGWWPLGHLVATWEFTSTPAGATVLVFENQ